MTYAFALTLAGLVLLYSGAYGVPVAEVLRGTRRQGDRGVLWWLNPEAFGVEVSGSGGGGAGGGTATTSDVSLGSTGNKAGAGLLRSLADIAHTRFRLTIREYPPYDPVDPSAHVAGSYHDSGRAFDASGSTRDMLAFARWVAREHGHDLTELIHTPLGFSIKNGSRTAPYATADHYNHVHVAI